MKPASTSLTCIRQTGKAQVRLSHTDCYCIHDMAHRATATCVLSRHCKQRLKQDRMASSRVLKASKYLLQPLYSLDAKRQQFLGFQLCSYPVLWWLQVSIAFLAPQDSDLLLYRGSDIYLGAYTTDTHVGRVAHDGSTTETT